MKSVHKIKKSDDFSEEDYEFLQVSQKPKNLLDHNFES